MQSKKTLKLSGRKKGFNIVEVMVSIAIFSLTMVMLTGSFVGFYKNYTNARKMQRDIENAQYAMNTMAKTLRTSEISSYDSDNNEDSFYLEAYDYSQEKCIKYFEKSGSIQYQEKSEPTGLPTGFDKDGCSGYGSSLSLISNVEKARVKWKDGRVTVALGIKSGTSVIPIQMSVSLRNAVGGSSGSGGSGGGETYSCSILPTDAEACQGTGTALTASAEYVLVSSCSDDTAIKCEAKCDSDHTISEDGKSCINSRIFNCTGNPLNSIWNTATKITQNWDSTNGWTPSSSATFGGPCTDKCCYACDLNFNWQNSNCVANTQLGTCKGDLPVGAEWNDGAQTDGKFTQTWNRLVFAPEVKDTSYSTTEGDCNYKCASGYSWDENENKCLLPFSATCKDGSGNTISPIISGSYKICKFTSNGTFEVPANTKEGSVEVLIVGGGGSGANDSYYCILSCNGNPGGGGGAGAIIEKTITVGSGDHAINIGAGGLGVTSGTGNSGGDSSAFEYTAKGGGPGSTSYEGTSGLGPEDGYCSSGGGGGGKCNDLYFGCLNSECSGAGGNPGGFGSSGAGGGGGGAGFSGNSGNSNSGGAGGAGIPSTISGTETYYGGGGGGCGLSADGSGGAGGGGSAGGSSSPRNGAINSGGGGGCGDGVTSGAGGSGIVIIRYPTP